MRTYIEQMLERLATLDAENEYLLYIARWKPFPESTSWLPPVGPNFQAHLKRFPDRLLRNLEHGFGVRVTERFLLPNVDLFHGCCQVIPPVKSTTTVLTRHHFTEKVTAISDFESEVFDACVPRADFIITPSQYTKDFVVENFKVPEERVRVIYHGVFDPKPVVSKDQIAALQTKYDLPKRFVLFLSRLIPSKRADVLLRAFKKIEDKVPDVGVVLAGRPDSVHGGEIEKLAVELGLESRVCLTGEIAHSEVPQFYAAAEAFAFPSVSEGFGIPIIEAMAMGCPVIGARATAIPEVMADAGLIFEKDNEEELADRLLAVLTDSSLHASLAEKGHQRSALFSWEKSAREHLAVYKEAA